MACGAERGSYSTDDDSFSQLSIGLCCYEQTKQSWAWLRQRERKSCGTFHGRGTQKELIFMYEHQCMCGLCVARRQMVQQAQPPWLSDGESLRPWFLWLDTRLRSPSMLSFIFSQITSTRRSNTCFTLMLSFALASKNWKPEGQQENTNALI